VSREPKPDGGAPTGTTAGTTGGAKPGAAARGGGGPRAIGALVSRLARPAAGKHGFAEATVLTEWASVVGTDLARHTRPERLAFPAGARRDGTLHLRVEGAWALEVQHMARQIVERVNGFFGYAAVARLTLRHGPVAPPGAPPGDAGEEAAEPDPAPYPEADAIARVASPELREALAGLGRAIRREAAAADRAAAARADPDRADPDRAGTTPPRRR